MELQDSASKRRVLAVDFQTQKLSMFVYEKDAQGNSHKESLRVSWLTGKAKWKEIFDIDSSHSALANCYAPYKSSCTHACRLG